MTIKIRLIIALGLLSVVLLISGGSGWYLLRDANLSMKSVFEDRVVPLGDLKAISDLYGTNVIDNANKVRNGSTNWEQGLAHIAGARVEIAKHWKAYSETYMEADEKSLADQTTAEIAKADGAIVDLAEIMRTKNKAGLDSFATAKLYLATDPVNALLDKLSDLQILDAHNAYDRSQANFGIAQWIMGGAAGLGLGSVIFALFTTFVRVVRPINAMTAAMTRLAGGDKTVDIPAHGNKDEIGAMAKAVDVFKQNMIETERLRIDQEALKARTETDKRALLNTLADDFEGDVRESLNMLASAATEMRATSQSMSATAEETSAQATAVAAAAEQASANVQTVASATEELSSSVAEIGRQVSQSTLIAGAAVTEADRTNLTVQGLSEAAQKIGDVVKLISDIASRTNLLALNATIEAARAGDAGKGFAVVASEVKSLANQTAKATKEIAVQVSAMQTATRDAVQAIESIGGTIGSINEIATAIGSAVEQQGAATQEIARNVHEAAQGTGQVSSTISGVNQAASETGVAATHVLASAEELGQQAETLRVNVDSFMAKIRVA